jgi:predicted CXXCH cytochrome family protein
VLKLSIDRRAGFWAVVLLLVVCGWPRTAAAQGGPRDWRVCTECHRNVDVERERALGHADSVTCMSCHHIGMSNDPKKVAAARTKVCQDCHTKVTPTHTRGKQGQPACSACHDIHTDAPLDKTPLPNARCQSCHESPHVLHAAAGEKVAC